MHKSKRIKGRSIDKASLILGLAFFCAFLFSPSNLLTQDLTHIHAYRDQHKIEYDDQIVQPQFPGGLSAWRKFIKKNANYPEISKQSDKQTTLGFWVMPDGRIDSIKVVRSINTAIDKESIRLLKLSSPWLPASRNGQTISSRQSIRVTPYYSVKSNY